MTTAAPNRFLPQPGTGLTQNATAPDAVIAPDKVGAGGHLSIPTIGVSAAVDETGLTNGSVDIPSDVSQTTWWNGSAGFNDSLGVSWIVGHVADDSNRPGALFHLNQMHVGQVINWTQGKTTKSFRVISTNLYSKMDALPQSLMQTNVAHELAVLTCDGLQMHADGTFHYADIRVVLAEEVS